MLTHDSPVRYMTSATISLLIDGCLAVPAVGRMRRLQTKNPRLPEPLLHFGSQKVGKQCVDDAAEFL